MNRITDRFSVTASVYPILSNAFQTFTSSIYFPGALFLRNAPPGRKEMAYGHGLIPSERLNGRRFPAS